MPRTLGSLPVAFLLIVAVSCTSTKPTPVVEIPVFDLASGAYTSAQHVGISTPTEDAEIRITRDGTDPDEASELYVTAVTIDTTTTLKARGYRTGWDPSEVATAVYAITDVATPILDPSAGTYTTVQDVTITCTTPEVTIRYTRDGSDPDETSTEYLEPVVVDTTTTVRARAWRTGMTPSGIAEAVYTIDFPDVAAPVFTPAAGTYTTDQSVSIACGTADAEIRYTTDGSDPTEASDLYGVPIDISVTTQFKARGFKDFMDPSPVVTADIIIDYPDVESPTFDPTPGTYTSDQVVSIACPTAGAAIYYTTDGSDPTEASTAYSAPFTVTTPTTVKARAYKSAMDPSPVAQGYYNINYPDVAMPSASVSGGVFASAVTVSVTCATAGASLHYTTNGVTPTQSDAVWTGDLVISTTTTLKVRGFATAMDPSPVLTQTYAIISGLIAHYPFTGNANDASGNAHDGTPVGSPALTTGRAGDVNGAYDLDGVDDYIQLADESAFDLGTFTISFWMKAASLPASEGPTTTNPGEWWIASKGPTWGNFRVGLFRYGGSSTGVMIYHHTDSGGSFSSSGYWSNASVYAGVWTHVTVVIGSDCRVYINGTLKDTAAIPNAPPLANNDSVLLGWASDGEANDYFTGVLDEVRFYSRALSATEVSQLYSNGG